ncbi:MAG: elongation factor P maturation arginine rhamnosyltransferase EarP [Caldimonas sp.]
MAAMRWSIFCRVVDNFGDIGFAWRLAADLAGRGEIVRLAVDDARALAWMAPDGAPGVDVVGWDHEMATLGDVLVETFGCGFPQHVVARLDATAVPPVCIDVEHLSAEDFVERSHGLPSPHFSMAGEARPTWFFYPGFGERTGGLLREPGLLERRHDFGNGRDWLAAKGVARREGERCVSLFCYENAAIDTLLGVLSQATTLLLLTPGPATNQVLAVLGPDLRRGDLRAVRLPALTQPEFDRLLWSCDLNFVRGEDSLIRAIWAGAPFVWQIYPQDDGAHAAKLDAFLDRFLQDAPALPAAGTRELFARWNGLCKGAAATRFALPEANAWAAHCRSWRDRLAGQHDLTTALIEFVASKR